MDVILKQDVSGLGQRGEVVSVSNGYFRNYLLPQSLGYKATAGAMAEADAMRKASAAKNQQSRADADAVASKLVPQVINISVKTDGSGTLFGSVGASDIVEAIEAQTGIEIDRKALKLDNAIKTTGSHMVMTQTHPDVQFPVTVEVTSEDE